MADQTPIRPLIRFGRERERRRPRTSRFRMLSLVIVVPLVVLGVIYFANNGPWMGSRFLRLPAAIDVRAEARDLLGRESSSPSDEEVRIMDGYLTTITDNCKLPNRANAVELVLAAQGQL